MINNLSYIVGVFLGDGCYYKRPFRSEIIIVGQDKDILEKVSRCCSKLGMTKYKVSSYRKNLFRIRITNSEFANTLNALTKGKTIIPDMTTKSHIREFVAGLMDTDGHIAKSKVTRKNKTWTRYAIGFTNSAPWLDNFLNILNYLGVKTGKKTLKRKYRNPLTEKDCYLIGLNIQSFIKSNLFFSCKRKQKRLNEYINKRAKTATRLLND